MHLPKHWCISSLHHNAPLHIIRNANKYCIHQELGGPPLVLLLICINIYQWRGEAAAQTTPKWWTNSNVRKNPYHMPRWTLSLCHDERVHMLLCRLQMNRQRYSIPSIVWDSFRMWIGTHYVSRVICLSFNMGAEPSAANTSYPWNKGFIPPQQQAPSSTNAVSFLS